MINKIKIPPLAWLFIFIAAQIFLSLQVSLYRFQFQFNVGAASIVLSLGIIICIMGVYSFKSHKTTVSPYTIEQTSRLVTTGIYSYTRNPMYLGFLLILISMAILLSEISSYLIIPYFVAILHYTQIKEEERILLKIFGNQYFDYQKRVRRWI